MAKPSIEGCGNGAPLGAEMRSFAWMPEVLPQRGHGLRPPSRRRLAWGSTMAIMAPSGGPLKTAGLQGESRRVWGPCPLTGSRVGSWNPSVDTRQVRSAGRAAQPGTSARRSGTGRNGARTACRRPLAAAATGACPAAGAAAAALPFSEARARRSGRAGRAHTSLAGQEQRHRCRDRARSRARRSGRGLGSVRRQHLELRRNGAARHTAAARETAGDCHERTRRSDDGEVI
jgi:hypothetical protein